MRTGGRVNEQIMLHEVPQVSKLEVFVHIAKIIVIILNFCILCTPLPFFNAGWF